MGFSASSSHSEEQHKLAVRALAWRFIGTWLVFMVVLVGLALITNIDWAKPYCQTALSSIFHRKVRVGHLSWTFGLNGLEIETARMSVIDSDGKPFLQSGRSQIGLLFVPLLKKQMIISHLDMKKPELWARRVGAESWNFRDILKLGPDISYLQFENGKLHITDECKNAAPVWKALDLDDVKLQFVWPHKKKKTPFYFSFKVPKPHYTTSFKLTGLGSGELREWQENKYDFQVEAEKVNADDFAPLLQAVSAGHFEWPGQNAANSSKDALKGLFNFHITAEGTLAKGLTANVQAEGEHLSMNAPGLGRLKANEATTEAMIHLDKKKITWSDTVTKIANIEIRSRGELLDWQNKDAQYKADLDSKVDDLSNLGGILTPDAKKSTAGMLDPTHLSGKAEIEMKINGDASKSNMVTDVKTPGLAIDEIVERLPKALKPAIVLMGLNKQSKVEGEIQFVPNESVKVSQAQIAVPGGTLSTTGDADFKKESAHFDFKARGINLKDAQKHFANSPEEFTEVSKLIYLPNRKSLILSGGMDLTGVLNAVKNSRDTTGQAIISGAQFGLNDGELKTRNLNGLLSWQNFQVYIHKLTGTIGDGTFDLHGDIKLVGNGILNLTIHSKHLELAQLTTLLKVLKINLPLFSEHRLFGKVTDLTIVITGSRTNPQVYFKGTPEDLCYQPAGMDRALRAKSGIITYDHDNLALSNVGFVTHGDVVATTLTIYAVSTNANVGEIKVKSSGIDLSDVNFYLSSAIMPGPLKKLYTGFLSQYHIASVHGRVYGDATCNVSGAKSNLNGTVGLTNVGAKLGPQKFPLEHISGLVSAAGDTLSVKSLSGTLNKSTFEVLGDILSYQSPKPRWHAKVTAVMHPQEMIELLPAMSEEVSKWNMKLTSTGPIDLHATVDGGFDHNSVVFAVASEAPYDLTLSGPFGAVHKPKDERLSLEGGMVLDKNSLKVESTNILVGDSPLLADGSLRWSHDLDSLDALAETSMTFNLKSPNSVPAKRLLAMFDPSANSDNIEGTIKYGLALAGTIGKPYATGKLSFDKISSPKYQVRDLTGTLELMNSSDNKDRQRARIDIPVFQYGELSARNFNADLALDPPAANFAHPKITIKNGTADVAGGRMSVDGWLMAFERTLNLDFNFRALKAEQLCDSMFGHEGELTGQVNAKVKLATSGADCKEALANLGGDGFVEVKNGTVARFGQLQTKLTQVNLLHQGVFGFNLNNLIQSVAPVRTGRFKEFSSEFKIKKGLLSIDSLRYKGDDMRLWGSGKANLPANTVEIEVAGKIPRVSPSMLKGPVGDVSRQFTLQRVINVATRGRLESLPSLPVLGEVGSDKPRVFAFKVASQLDQPKTLAQSIEHSFHWLPSRPTASAHPVPGLKLSSKNLSTSSPITNGDDNAVSR